MQAITPRPSGLAGPAGPAGPLSVSCSPKFGPSSEPIIGPGGKLSLAWLLPQCAGVAGAGRGAERSSSRREPSSQSRRRGQALGQAGQPIHQAALPRLPIDRTGPRRAAAGRQAHAPPRRGTGFIGRAGREITGRHCARGGWKGGGVWRWHLLASSPAAPPEGQRWDIPSPPCRRSSALYSVSGASGSCAAPHL